MAFLVEPKFLYEYVFCYYRSMQIKNALLNENILLPVRSQGSCFPIAFPHGVIIPPNVNSAEQQEMSHKPGSFVILELPILPALLWRRINKLCFAQHPNPHCSGTVIRSGSFMV